MFLVAGLFEHFKAVKQVLEDGCRVATGFKKLVFEYWMALCCLLEAQTAPFSNVSLIINM